MAAIAQNNVVIKIGDDITVLGTCTAISGKGPSATVTFTTQSGDVISLPAVNFEGPQSGGPAQSRSGKGFSVGDRIILNGSVTSLSGTGTTAVVSTKATVTPTVVTHAAATVVTSKKN